RGAIERKQQSVSGAASARRCERRGVRPPVRLTGGLTPRRSPRRGEFFSVMPPEERDPSQAGSEQPGSGEETRPATRELILLTPFRVPAQSALYLGSEDVACFLNG